MDELIERIRAAQDKMLEEKLTANTVVLNGKKYGCLFELCFRPSICGLTAELANLPDNMDFIVQYRAPQPKTNAAAIRSMSDDELAEFMHVAGGCGPTFDLEYCQGRKQCGGKNECWLDWLRQEAST